MRLLLLFLAGVTLWMLSDEAPTHASTAATSHEEAARTSTTATLTGGTVAERTAEPRRELLKPCREALVTTEAVTVHDLLMRSQDLLFMSRELQRSRDTALSPDAWADAPENAALQKKLDQSHVRNELLVLAKDESMLDLVQRVDTVTKIPIIVSPDGRTVIEDERPRLVLPHRPTAREILVEVCYQVPQAGWVVRNGVVVLTSAAKARGR